MSNEPTPWPEDGRQANNAIIMQRAKAAEERIAFVAELVAESSSRSEQVAKDVRGIGARLNGMDARLERAAVLGPAPADDSRVSFWFKPAAWLGWILAAGMLICLLHSRGALG